MQEGMKETKKELRKEEINEVMKKKEKNVRMKM